MNNKIKISQLELETSIKEDALIAIVQDDKTKAIKSKDLLKEVNQKADQVDSKCKAVKDELDQHIANCSSGNSSGSIAKSDKVDYMGKQHDSLKKTNDANVEYLLRKTNIQKYEGSSITANKTYAKQVNNVILKGVTKYKDVDTEEFVDSFEQSRDLELVGGKSEKLVIESHIDAINKETIQMKTYGSVNLVKTDNANFIIKTGGMRYSGATSSNFYTANIGGPEFGTYVIEFDGRLISGDISSAFGVHLEAWSTFVEGYDGKLPIDGKYRAVVKSNTNTANNRSTAFKIFTTNASSVTNPVEYEVKNLKVYCVTDNTAKYQSSNINVPVSTELYGLNKTYDYIDLISGYYVRNFGKITITDEMIDRFSVYEKFINNFGIIFDYTDEKPLKLTSNASTPHAISDKMKFTGWNSPSYDDNTISFTSYRDGTWRAFYGSSTLTLEEWKTLFRQKKPTIIYQLAEPVVTKIDLQSQKIYSYDGTTHYTCQSQVGYPSPLLSIEVPTDLAALVNSQEQQIKLLTQENNIQNELINITLMATEQMYSLVEPLLANVLINNKDVNPLVNMYAAMIKKGLIDQVPEKYRDLVNKNIEIL